MPRPRADSQARLAALALCALTATALPGCYREVVSAKGLGAAAYQNEVGKGGNYSGLSFDDAEKESRPRYSAPGMGASQTQPR